MRRGHERGGLCIGIDIGSGEFERDGSAQLCLGLAQLAEGLQARYLGAQGRGDGCVRHAQEGFGFERLVLVDEDLAEIDVDRATEAFGEICGELAGGVRHAGARQDGRVDADVLALWKLDGDVRDAGFIIVERVEQGILHRIDGGGLIGNVAQGDAEGKR